jgi:cysteine desulfurase family protein (TIGR01976 family)
MRPLADARTDFPSLSRGLAFFDGPGGTQVPRQVIEAISRYYERSNANTHGAFATSVETDRAIDAARAAAADLLGAPSPASISFGANMTTLNFALARAIAREIRPGDEIVITQLDHEANRGPWKTLAERGAVLREIPLRSDGTLELEALDALVGPRTRLVAIGWASNAIGTVNDVARAVAAARTAGALSVIDAVHYAPHFSIDAAALDPDFLLCSAYKFYGPHVGILYARPGALDALEPDRLLTQDQNAPVRIETGTLNHAALAGVTAAIDYIASFGAGASRRQRLVSAMERIGAHERALAERYWRALDGAPGVRRWGPGFEGRRAPTVSITVEGIDARAVTERLAAEGIAAWDGDFYARRAVEIFGLASRGGLVRSGMALYTTEAEVDRLARSVAAVTYA